MATRSIAFRYDRVGDIVYVDPVAPYAGQDSDMIDDFVVARTNPATGHVENLEVLFFMEWARAGEPVSLPVNAIIDVDGPALASVG